MTKTLLLLAILFVSTVAVSQEYFEAPYLKPAKAQTSIYDLNEAFQLWAKDKDLQREKGWKQYKRWEKQVLSNVDANGNLLSTRQQYLNFLKSQQMPVMKGTQTWVSLNPNTVPNPVDTNDIFGMGRLNCITFHPTDSLTFWVGASNGGVWKTTDGGQNWTPIMDNAPNMRVSDIAVQHNNTDIMYVCSGDIDYIYNAQSAEGTRNFGMGLLKSYDGGNTWDTTGLSFPLQGAYSSLLRKVLISHQDSSHLLAFGGSGTYRSTDGGDTWNHVDQHVIMDVEQNPLNDSVIYASTYRLVVSGGIRSKILKSTDFGETWVELNAGIPYTTFRTELAIAPSDTNIIYALAARQAFEGLFKSVDGGATWDTIGLADSIPNLMGHYDGGVTGLFTDVSGQGWYDLALAVDPVDPNIIHTGGVNIWTSTDGGKNWAMASYWTRMLGNSIHADQHQMKIHPLTGELFVCNDGGLVKTDSVKGADFNDIIPCYDIAAGAITPGCYNFPTKWVNLSHTLHNSEHYYLGQNGKEPYDIAVGNQDNGTRMYRNQKWQFIKGADGGKPLLNPDDTSIVYASYQFGRMFRSEDGGKTFGSNLTAGLACNTFIPPFHMHPHNPDVLYAGFNNAHISYDGGDNWSLLKLTSYDVHDLVIPEKNPHFIYVLDRRYVYVSEDSATTWEKNMLPANMYDHRLAVDFDDPNELYVTYSGYVDTLKVFKSTDKGKTWQNLSFNLPNIPVNCIALQSGYSATGDTLTGVYIGTDVGIYYINDSLIAENAGWQRYGTGLPNVTIYDLAINYPAQKLRAATYGRGMWEIDLYQTSHGVNVGLENNDKPYSGLKVYPNPAQDVLNIHFEAPEEKVQEIHIYNSEAKRVYLEKVQQQHLYQGRISMQNLPAGIYFVRLQSDRKVYISKVIKQ